MLMTAAIESENWIIIASLLCIFRGLALHFAWERRRPDRSNQRIKRSVVNIISVCVLLMPKWQCCEFGLLFTQWMTQTALFFLLKTNNLRRYSVRFPSHRIVSSDGKMTRYIYKKKVTVHISDRISKPVPSINKLQQIRKLSLHGLRLFSGNLRIVCRTSHA